MQNLRFKRQVSVSLLLLLTVLFVFWNPGDAFADLLGCMSEKDKAGIFKTMACKITTTLFDVRKIVYVLGGLGLVAFTFAAIFNKISFKHLANIALSLFLLSMMTPFIEYFTQDEGVPLTYGHFLQPDFEEADYSTTFGECSDCPSSPIEASSVSMMDASSVMSVGGGSSAGGSSAGGASFGGASSGNEKLDNILKDGPRLDGLNTGVPSLDLSREKLATVGGTQQDNRTGWQKLKDTIKTVKDEGVKAYNTASSTIATAKTVYNAVDMTVRNVKNVGSVSEAISAGVGAIDNYTRITGAITSAAATIGTNYGDKEGEKSWGQKVDDFFKGSDQRASEAKDTAQDVGVINATIDRTLEIPNDIRDIFK